ncbi:MAG: 2OG-Fe(II) oxygenase [Synechococcales cyanobacterium RM1_1_8]|nr:2OG-Fe(II) oxygenase [Synechococcales cyanobacterium RM1_1_8]
MGPVQGPVNPDQIGPDQIGPGPRLRSSYDLGQQVNDAPLIYVFEDFLGESECAALIAAAQGHLQRAVVSDAKSGAVSEGRTGQNAWVRHRHTPEIGALCDRISALVNLPLDQAESLQVIHYAETQEYRPHYDAWDGNTERGDRCMAQGGQRLVTCLLYLNAVAAGGGTCFPKLDLEIRAIPGRMVLFHNCYPATSLRHPASLHGGLPVLAGEKWACNLWFRERRYGPAPAVPKTSGFKRVI